MKDGSNWMCKKFENGFMDRNDCSLNYPFNFIFFLR